MWESLSGLIQNVDWAWLLCGDFNEVRDSSDRINSQFHPFRAERFNKFIRENNLIDIPISGKRFTRVSDDGVKLSKLDRFLVTENFINLWDDLSVIALDRRLSDHCPLVLRDKIIDFGPKPFKVFDEWFNCDDVGDIILGAWKESVRGSRKDCNFRDKLKNVKSALKTWSKNTFGKLDCDIVELKKEAREWEIKAETNQISSDEREIWLECRRKWIEKEKVKSNMLKQKARVRWIIEGDENSKYFHSSIRRKNNKCNIRGLNINGIWNENPCEIKDAISDHLATIFKDNSSYGPVIVPGIAAQLQLHRSAAPTLSIAPNLSVF
ncbi:uncharacterized protein [Rutidosis leptorrhynchoides]|uniref:uncharacterized protein n=1 Tax=Rutidosis leptorrhynchoides TaxID=125765 RepID=UPI003A98EA32